MNICPLLPTPHLKFVGVPYQKKKKVCRVLWPPKLVRSELLPPYLLMWQIECINSIWGALVEDRAKEYSLWPEYTIFSGQTLFFPSKVIFSEQELGKCHSSFSSASVRATSSKRCLLFCIKFEHPTSSNLLVYLSSQPTQSAESIKIFKQKLDEMI